MSALAELANRLFPTIGAIDEERQIGRALVIAELGDRFASGRDTLMIEPRQVGKTSALRAGVQVALRSCDLVVARADLKADGISNSAQLGQRLVETAVEHGLSVGLLRERVKRRASGAGDALAAPVKALGAVAEALGVSPEATAVITAVEQALERVGLTPFDQVLAALEGYAQISGRRTVVFLDEVQEIDEWKGEGEAVERALVAAARREHRQLRFVFAGSHDTALETLFAPDRPLHVLSDRCPLPPIDEADWLAGLAERLREGGLECDDEVLSHLLGESRGHPLATMHLSKVAFLAARKSDARRLELVHVDDGLAEARKQLWWKEFTGT
jgi:hypothetical protein